MAKAIKIRDVKKVLKRDTSKTRMKRYEQEVRAGRMPPEWSAKLGKIIFKAITKWNSIANPWKLDIAS